MQEIQYHLLAEVEARHWWHRNLRRVVAETLAKHGGNSRLDLLDVGCGTGGLLTELRSLHTVHGVDASPLALSYCRQRGLKHLARGRVDQLPFADACVGAVVAIDVLSHESIPSDLVAMREIRRVLKPGGIFLLQLSAFEWLRGRHDESVHQARRYTRRQVEALLAESGFSILESRYRLAFLPPLMVINNLMAKLRSRVASTQGGKADIALPPFLVNRILGAVSVIDWKFGSRMPLGSSVFCVASRQEG